MRFASSYVAGFFMRPILMLRAAESRLHFVDQLRVMPLDAVECSEQFRPLLVVEMFGDVADRAPQPHNFVSDQKEDGENLVAIHPARILRNAFVRHYAEA